MAGSGCPVYGDTGDAGAKSMIAVFSVSEIMVIGMVIF